MSNAALWTPWGEMTAAPDRDENIPSELRALGAAIGKVPERDFLKAEIDDNFYVDFRNPANDNLPPVVAFTGVAGSGKSTATRYLVERHGYTLVKFAGPLKRMMYALGLTEDEVEGELKELPQDRFYGKSPRYLMQTVGTDWARKMIGEDFWVRMWQGEVSALLDVGHRIVTDDLRFPNEAAAVRAKGGDIFKLAGRGGIAGGHESERMNFIADLVIANDNTPEVMFGKIEEALRRYG